MRVPLFATQKFQRAYKYTDCKDIAKICGWRGKAKVERTSGIEHDAGEVRRATGHNSGPSVQEEPASPRGDQGVGTLEHCILAGEYLNRKNIGNSH
jgi:hypothetical protein